MKKNTLHTPLRLCFNTLCHIYILKSAWLLSMSMKWIIKGISVKSVVSFEMGSTSSTLRLHITLNPLNRLNIRWNYISVRSFLRMIVEVVSICDLIGTGDI